MLLDVTASLHPHTAFRYQAQKVLSHSHRGAYVPIMRSLVSSEQSHEEIQFDAPEVVLTSRIGWCPIMAPNSWKDYRNVVVYERLPTH